MKLQQLGCMEPGRLRLSSDVRPVAGPLSVANLLSQACSHWIEVQVGEQVHPVAVVAHQPVLESALEHRPVPLVGTVEVLAEPGLKSLHRLAQVSSGGLQEEVEVIWHDGKCVHHHATPLRQGSQVLQKQPGGRVVAEHGSTARATVHDVVACTREIDSWTSCHP